MGFSVNDRSSGRLKSAGVNFFQAEKLMVLNLSSHIIELIGDKHAYEQPPECANGEQRKGREQRASDPSFAEHEV